MRVLLTGAFGNIGVSALEALLERQHRVRCFDIQTKTTEETAKRFGDAIEVVWGDLRDSEAVAEAVEDQNVVIHLGFIIPKLSASGIESESAPDLAWDVNVRGTLNVLDALRAQPNPPRLVFASSYHVYGLTQDQPPPRTVDDPVRPVEHYARHKVACEWLVKASRLDWTILRFSATLPISLRLDPYMFEIPLANRMEFVHTRDVGVALANAVTNEEVWGKTLLIGGGPECQLTYREIVEGVMQTMGIGMLPEDAFGSEPFATDWVDSSESESLLQYQKRTFQDYLRDMRDLLGAKHILLRLFGPLVRLWLLRKSTFWRAKRSGT